MGGAEGPGADGMQAKSMTISVFSSRFISSAELIYIVYLHIFVHIICMLAYCSMTLCESNKIHFLAIRKEVLNCYKKKKKNLLASLIHINTKH